VDTKELETLNPLHYSLIDVNGGIFVLTLRERLLFSHHTARSLTSTL
jgi:hypothetical protein